MIYPSRRHLAPRTRVVIDFLVEQLKASVEPMEMERVWGENRVAACSVTPSGSNSADFLVPLRPVLATTWSVPGEGVLE